MRVRASSRKTPSIALVTAKRVLLLDAAHRHAEVRAFDDDGDAQGIDLLADGVGDLAGEPLLHLQPSREHVDESRDLAESDDAALRDVRDVALAEERQQMVLAEAVEVDVPARSPSRYNRP